MFIFQKLFFQKTSLCFTFLKDKNIVNCLYSDLWLWGQRMEACIIVLKDSILKETSKFKTFPQGEVMDW